MSLMGMVARWRLDADSARAHQVQAEFLKGLLDDNKDTEYGKRHGFAEMLSEPAATEPKEGDRDAVETAFVNSHPLTKYPDYADYVGRMASGDDSDRTLLTKEPVSRLGVTSGTSGQASMLPVVHTQRRIFFEAGITVVFDVVARCFPAFQSSMQRTLKLFFSTPARQTPSGLPYGPNSSAPEDSKRLLQLYTTPPPAYDSRVSEPDALYLYALFALADRQLGAIESNFVSAVLNFFENVENRYDSLVSDIAQGTITKEGLNIPEDVRQQLEHCMKPDPARAQQLLDARIEEAPKVGLAKAIWPNLHFVLAVSTGTFDLYGEKLRKRFLSADKGSPSESVPIYSPIYAATEGLIGVNVDGPANVQQLGTSRAHPQELPHNAVPQRRLPQQQYLLVPRAMFMEFIPVEESGADQPRTLTMADSGPGGRLKEGKEYELVATTKCGLYRYRMGDVIKVVGFHGKAPLVEVCYRQGQLLNVRGEKMPEDTLYRCLRETIDDWGGDSNDHNCHLTDYTTIETTFDPLRTSSKSRTSSSSKASPSYIVYVEATTAESHENSSHQFSEVLDQRLQSTHPVFRSFRAKGAIGPPEVRLVTPGSFKDMRRLLVSQEGMSPNQLKMPRVLRSSRLASVLQDRVIV